MAFSLTKILKGLRVYKENTLTPDNIDIVPAGTAGSTTTINSSQTVNRTLTLPDATDTLVGKATSDVFTNKTFDADGSGNSITNIENGDIKAAAAIAVNKLAAVTVSKALASDASGFIVASGTSAVELGYVTGVTSAIQTQLNSNATAISDHLADAVDAHDASAISSTASGQLVATDVQSALTEIELEKQARTYSTTATAAGTTTLTVASNYQQHFTGVTTQTIVMPVATTMTLGFGFEIVNRSTGLLTINSSGANAITTVASGNTVKIVCILTSGTDAASWSTSSFATVSNISSDLFSGTGAQTAFTLTTAPATENNTFVFVGGVYQQKDTYSLSGTTLTFSAAPPSGTSNIAVDYATALTIGTPSDGTVSTVKIVDSNVTAAKLASDSVTTVKILDANVTQAKLAARATGTTVAAGGIAVSTSSGVFSLTGGSTTDVTNLSVTITTTGRPVALMVVPDGSANQMNLVATRSSISFTIEVFVLRDATIVYDALYSDRGDTLTLIQGNYAPPSCIDVVAAGTYTYKVRLKNVVSTNSAQVNMDYAKLLAYEL